MSVNKAHELRERHDLLCYFEFLFLFVFIQSHMYIHVDYAIGSKGNSTWKSLEILSNRGIRHRKKKSEGHNIPTLDTIEKVMQQDLFIPGNYCYTIIINLLAVTFHSEMD